MAGPSSSSSSSVPSPPPDEREEFCKALVKSSWTHYKLLRDRKEGPIAQYGSCVLTGSFNILSIATKIPILGSILKAVTAPVITLLDEKSQQHKLKRIEGAFGQVTAAEFKRQFIRHMIGAALEIWYSFEYQLGNIYLDNRDKGSDVLTDPTKLKSAWKSRGTPDGDHLQGVREIANFAGLCCLDYLETIYKSEPKNLHKSVLAPGILKKVLAFYESFKIYLYTNVRVASEEWRAESVKPTDFFKNPVAALNITSNPSRTSSNSLVVISKDDYERMNRRVQLARSCLRRPFDFEKTRFDDPRMILHEEKLNYCVNPTDFTWSSHEDEVDELYKIIIIDPHFDIKEAQWNVQMEMRNDLELFFKSAGLRKQMMVTMDSFEFNVKQNLTRFVCEHESGIVEDVRKWITDVTTKKVNGILILQGLGGIGKSALADYIIKSRMNEPPYMYIWINAESFKSMEKDWRALARILEERGVQNCNSTDLNMLLTTVYNYFPKIFIVFDNAQAWSGQNGVVRFVREHKSLCIIVTTRNGNLWSELTVPKECSKRMIIEGMADYLCETFILDEVGVEEGLRGEKEKAIVEVRKLWKCFGGLPLALWQAVKYLKKDRAIKVTLASYVEMCLRGTEETKKNLLDYKANHEDVTTYGTWDKTLRTIRDYGSGGEEGIRILQFLALLYPLKEVHVEFLYDLFGPPLHPDNGLDLLIQYSMIRSVEHDGGFWIQIHPLVQLVTYLQLHLNDQENGWTTTGGFRVCVQRALYILRELKDKRSEQGKKLDARERRYFHHFYTNHVPEYDQCYGNAISSISNGTSCSIPMETAI